MSSRFLLEISVFIISFIFLESFSKIVVETRRRYD
jgi:hypothetical protein